MSNADDRPVSIAKFDIILVALLCDSIRSNPSKFYNKSKPELDAIKSEFDRLRTELSEYFRSSSPPLPKGTTLYGK